MPRRASGLPARPARPDASAIVARLSAAYPGATTELDFSNAFQLLVATMLSAQSTDARVNQVSPALFARYPDAHALAGAGLRDVERLVKATGFFRTKARAIVGMSRRLVDAHGGQVPSAMEALVELPGVGRKTANVVLGHALGVPGLPVDRHVLRVAGRLGLARGRTPEAVEQELCSQLPAETWTLASDCLILHGRRVCRPKPLCHTCMVSTQCSFFRGITATGATDAGQAARQTATSARRVRSTSPGRAGGADKTGGGARPGKRSSGR
jgi:endonuclease-3